MSPYNFQASSKCIGTKGPQAPGLSPTLLSRKDSPPSHRRSHVHFLRSAASTWTVYLNTRIYIITHTFVNLALYHSKASPPCPYRRPPLCLTAFNVVSLCLNTACAFSATPFPLPRSFDPLSFDESFSITALSLSSSTGRSLQAHASANSPLTTAVIPNDKMHAGLNEGRRVLLAWFLVLSGTQSM